MYSDRFYEDMAAAYLEPTAWTRLRLAQVQRMVDPQPGEKIIDLGCGMGAIAHFCSTFGAEAVGVDSSPAAIQAAKRLFNEASIAFYRRDVSDLWGIDDESFDKAVSADLVEHVTQTSFGGMTREAFRVLKPGGTLSIYTPNPAHLFERLKAHNLVLKQNLTHIDLKPAQRLVSTLEATGFGIKTVYYAPSFIPIYSLIESCMERLPVIGGLFRYRTCINAIKLDRSTIEVNRTGHAG